MIDHLGIIVSDYERARSFYEHALAPLGYELLVEVQGWAGFGEGGKPDLWISQGLCSTTVHVALRCESRAVVDAFHSRRSVRVAGQWAAWASADLSRALLWGLRA